MALEFFKELLLEVIDNPTFQAFATWIPDMHRKKYTYNKISFLHAGYVLLQDIPCICVLKAIMLK